MNLESLTSGERVKLPRGTCPDCEKQLLDGMPGSAAVNIECQSCSTIFSMVMNFSDNEVRDLLEVAQ